MPGNPNDLWLDPIPNHLRERAAAALAAGDVFGFLGQTDNDDSLELVCRNAAALLTRGVYERALLDAFTGARVNHARWPQTELRFLFERANRDRLCAAGDPLPGPGPFTLYRGVAGRGAARRVRGLSWTASLDRAKFFASRFSLHDPAVFRATVTERDVLAYVNDRNEQEFIVLLPADVRTVRLRA